MGAEPEGQTPVQRGMLGAMREGRPHDLLARARAGDRAAFDALVAEHLPQVWRVVFRVLRHHEDTEDVVQETFLTAYRGLAGFREESSLSTWLHRIAVSRALNHRQRASEKLRRASRSLDEPDAPVAASTAPSALRTLESKELLRRLAACLDQLPPAWRAVLALRDAESLSYDEIARTLGIALGTVRSRLARARTDLKTCVEGGG
jgi:RNA polymerase sigma-70 factor (ECF subfamily)